jgi:hypothetical protein
MSKVHVQNSRKGKLKLRFGVTLPGKAVTPVDADDWAKCKGDPVTRHYLDSQEIKVMPTPSGETKSPEVDAGPVSWAKLNAKETIAKIKECDDVDGLEALYDEDNRSTVEDAIMARLEDLKESQHEDNEEG